MTDAAARRGRLAIGAVFALALAVRVAYLAALAGNWDTEAYRQVAETLARGGTLYGDTPHYNYAPVWAFALRGLDLLASRAGVALHTAVGALLLAADAATAWLLFRIARENLRQPPMRAAGAALVFFANPISVFVTGFHAQFDNLAILFLVAAVFLAGREPARRLGAAGALAASLLVKHVTFFHPLLFARDRGRRARTVLLVLAPYAVFFASFLPYWSDRSAVLERVFAYRSLAEEYGTAMLPRLPLVPSWLPSALFAGAALAGVAAFRRLEIARACLLLFLVLLVFLPGIVQYYFVWPIALGSLFPGAGYAVFTLTVSAFFLGSPDGLDLPLEHLPGWHGVWWSAVFWLLWELRGLARKKEA